MRRRALRSAGGGDVGSPNWGEAADDQTDGPASGPGADVLVRRFVEHWGMMARAWGINSSMGELFALLYMTGEDWTADDLRGRLDVSRGNVSMNLRELIAWGVVKKVHKPGERRDLYRAEADVWTLFQRIMMERKRREIDPTLRLLDDLAGASSADPRLDALRGRVETLRFLMTALDELSERLMAMNADDLAELCRLFADEPHPEADRP